MEGYSTYKEIFFLSLVPILVYLNSITGEFVHDDIPAIVNNPDVTGSSGLINLLQSDYWGGNIHDSRSHKSFRPLTIATFRLTAHIFGLSPVWYHLLNIFLHSSVSVFLYILATSRLKLSKGVSALSCLLFSLHPVHTEAVSGIVGRADLLTALFMLASFYLATSSSSSKQTQIGSYVFAVLGLMSKEIGITVIIINISFLVLTRYCLVSWGRILVNLFILMTLTLVRVTFNRTLPSFIDQDNPASYERDCLTRFRTYLYLGVFNMKKLICPDNLSYDWQMGSVPLVHSFTDLRNLQSAALTAIVVGIFLQLFQRYFASVYTKLKVESSVRGLAFSILFLVVPFLPASNIFFQVGFVAAERILYVPSIGFCVLVALGASKLYASVPSWLQKSFQIVLLVSLTSFAAKTFTRNFAWNSKFSLFRSGLQSTQNNAKIFYNYGNMARENGNSETAKLCYKEAIRLWPSYVIAWNNLATLSDNETEIEQLLRKALLLDPSHTTSLFNLADLYRQRHEYRKAVYYFSICLKFRECQHNRAGVLLGECKQQIKLNSKKTQKQQFATMDKTKELYR